MFGVSIRGKKQNDSAYSESRDVAKVFFDSFSKRVGSVEEMLQGLTSEFEKLKRSSDRGQISDLVLLDRLQRAEKLLEESMAWIKRVADRVAGTREAGVVKIDRFSLRETPVEAETALEGGASAPVRRVISAGGDLGGLPSITTPTELEVLSLLAGAGPKSAPEIGRVVGRSREHTARLMKRLFEEGYVRRDQTRIPFRYSVVERVKESFRKAEAKAEGGEVVSAPQT